VPHLTAKQFRYESKKFEAAELTALTSEIVKPDRVAECPVHLEARVNAMHRLGNEKRNQLGGGIAAEIEVLRVHVASDFVLKATPSIRKSGRRSFTTCDTIFDGQIRSWERRSGPKRKSTIRCASA
jgi:flavin reductase (DIM6/NTAB) family NADH-FMN oxidoreductase RutF